MDDSRIEEIPDDPKRLDDNMVKLVAYNIVSIRPGCERYLTGSVIMVADCPLLWVSKVQSLVATSTLEAEYIALSHSMKELIPLH